MLTSSLSSGIVRAARHDRHVLGYASGNFGKAILLGSLDVTLLFLLTDIVGIAPHSVSLLMTIVLSGDLVFDVAAGRLAAMAERRGVGHARLIAWCTAPCALAFCALYSLPALRIGEPAVIATLILVLRAAFATVDVPHNSLLARVTTDSRARGRASGYRTVFSSIAGVVVATVIAPAVTAAAATPSRIALLGALGALLFCAALLLAAWSSGTARLPVQPPPRPPPRTRLLPRPDRLFAAMAAVALVTGFATPMFVKTLLYLCTYVLHRAAFAGQVLLTLALSQLLGAALWIALVRRHDKTTLLAASHAVTAAGIVLFAAAGDHETVLLAVSVVIGIGFAGVYMLPWGILADIIDFAEFRHRERQETMSFAAVLVILKGGGAAALAAIGWTLGRLGYVPGAAQPDGVLLGMKALAFGLPLLGAGVAILVLRRVRIGHALHARVCRVNRARRSMVKAG